MVRLTYGQQQRLKTLCQNNRRPAGISHPRWNDLRHGYLATLNEIDLVILREALGPEFFLAMMASRNELEH